MKKPLKESELETILRDEAFNNNLSFFKGNTFLLDKFAHFLKTNNHIVKINGQLHTYKDGVYCNYLNEIEKAMIYVIPNLTKTRRKEVLSYLDLICTEVKEADSTLIAFKNGIYDVLSDKLIDFNPEIILTNIIPWDYNPGAECELVDNTLEKLACNDAEIFNLLCECIGYCLFRKNELGKSFLLNGGGANGKSTFIDMIKTLLGDSNISSLDLADLGDRFKTSEICNKLANLGDDIGEEFIANTSVFKKLVTGDRITVERKGVENGLKESFSKISFLRQLYRKFNLTTKNTMIQGSLYKIIIKGE